ncbi:MAG TPA: ankyrin repeat domain-containing protein, partial [Candidatus Babeliales bacterium]|nr:ankyrin repeat domain-containing protein [Candidatus Babeliales bacterium]
KLYFELINGTNFSLAAYTDNWREVERLLTHRLVDVNARDEDGQTGLMIAVKNVNPAMVNCLLRYRADVRAGFNYNLWHGDCGFIPIMFLILADTANEFYQEAAAIAIIKALNNYELALTKRDMLNGSITKTRYATPGQYDQQFYQLMRSHFGAPESVSVLISCYNAKFTMPLF